ncbi:MAG: 7-cyano-7-deazaguanine synthase QueC [Candidatus Omnitrophica bacterium]|nr:7-cyano-7-deazaguanine synthase QueC [Candidatus Omnitrophota bacterium]
MREKGVILLSGGIDSTVTLYLAKKYKIECFALIFDYNQRHKKEVFYALKNAKKLKIPYRVLRINLGWGGSALTDSRIKLPQRRIKRGIPSTYVPARNLIFLSFAFSLAEVIKAKKIFIGAHTQDYSGYPDCRGEFLNSFQVSANLGIKERGIEIVAPLLDKDKAEIIKLGLSLGVDFSQTWSCYKGGKFPCLKCDSCQFRMEGFKKAGIEDPLLRRRKIKRRRF